MNHNQKALNLQEYFVIRDVKNSSANYFHHLITQPDFIEIFKQDLPVHRHRIYTPVQTLSMFLSQAMSDDRSCQRVVNDAALHFSSRHYNCSVATGAYCKARQRLPESAISKLAGRVAQLNERKVKSTWRWRGRNVYLVDGTTITMPDTQANQKAYPQPAFQARGLGFPICRIVGIISLATGSLINAAVGPFRGKGASEQVLLRQMLDTFKPGDIVLADAFYSTYSLMVHMIEHSIDIVFVQNGARSRTTNFSTGTSLGKEDHLITIRKPKDKPEWMSQEEFDAKPDKITIRELKTGGKLLITTMLCARSTSKAIIKKLYKQRWHIEVDFRNIKATLGLKSFSCKTPEMVLKEMWVYFLAYNLIRSLMLTSALYANLLPRQISFKHTLQLLKSFIKKFQGVDYETLLILIAKRRIGNREGRVEPRAIKKRHNDYPLLMKQRSVAKEEIRKYGHPKKVK